MNDVIAPKWPSLIPLLVAATMFLKSNMSLIPNNSVDVTESLIWNALIPSCPELSDDINSSDDKENENEEEEDLFTSAG